MIRKKDFDHGRTDLTLPCVRNPEEKKNAANGCVRLRRFEWQAFVGKACVCRGTLFRDFNDRFYDVGFVVNALVHGVLDVVEIKNIGHNAF